MWVSRMTRGSQEWTVLEAEMSLIGHEWQKHCIVTGPDALCILSVDYLRGEYNEDLRGYR